jgi:hypothetical protein
VKFACIDCCRSRCTRQPRLERPTTFSTKPPAAGRQPGASCPPPPATLCNTKYAMLQEPGRRGRASWTQRGQAARGTRVLSCRTRTANDRPTRPSTAPTSPTSTATTPSWLALAYISADSVATSICVCGTLGGASCGGVTCRLNHACLPERSEG